MVRPMKYPSLLHAQKQLFLYSKSLASAFCHFEAMFGFVKTTAMSTTARSVWQVQLCGLADHGAPGCSTDVIRPSPFVLPSRNMKRAPGLTYSG